MTVHAAESASFLRKNMTQEPAAWIAFATDGSESSAVYSLYEQARAAADEWGWDVAPLYAGLTLTVDEREAVEDAASRYVEGITPKAQEYTVTLRFLLERTK